MLVTLDTLGSIGLDSDGLFTVAATRVYHQSPQ